eukprot:SAG22_NODE_1280_length_4899_cov_5.374792_4_plen_111_part_00
MADVEQGTAVENAPLLSIPVDAEEDITVKIVFMERALEVTIGSGATVAALKAAVRGVAKTIPEVRGHILNCSAPFAAVGAQPHCTPPHTQELNRIAAPCPKSLYRRIGSG